MPLTSAGSMPPLIEPGWARLGLPFALTLLAYAAAGGLSLLIAIPPGYASPLYPAAGIGLASVLVYGRRMLGAVALGAFFVNALPADRPRPARADDLRPARGHRPRSGAADRGRSPSWCGAWSASR